MRELMLKRATMFFLSLSEGISPRYRPYAFQQWQHWPCKPLLLPHHAALLQWQKHYLYICVYRLMGGCIGWHLSLRHCMTNGCLFFLKVPLCSFKVLKQWIKSSCRGSTFSCWVFIADMFLWPCRLQKLKTRVQREISNSFSCPHCSISICDTHAIKSFQRTIKNAGDAQKIRQLGLCLCESCPKTHAYSFFFVFFLPSGFGECWGLKQPPIKV